MTWQDIENEERYWRAVNRRRRAISPWLLWALILVAAVALWACDPVVETHPTGAPVTRSYREGCSRTSFCFTCFPGFDGKMECGFKLSNFCPGSHDATYEETPVREVHKSGKTTEDVVRTLIAEGPCE